MTGPIHDLATSREPVAELRTFHRNPRRGDVDAIARSLAVQGQYRPIVVNRGTFTLRRNEVLAGNHTLKAARELGWSHITVCWVDVDDDQAARIVAADNRTADLGGYDDAVLADLLGDLDSLDGTGYTDSDLAALLAPDEGDDDPDDDLAAAPGGTLAERYGVPPFTVLDARSGVWQDRKRRWLALGLRGALGRSGELTGHVGDAARLQARIRGLPATAWETGETAGTSVFDPVLCELLIRWYSAPDARVLDPFAGGSVRGLVAAHLGRSYVGVDLRPEQVAANCEQGADWLARGLIDACPLWITGDGRRLAGLVPPDVPHDLMLTCPPYFDLEVYSDDPADLSRCADYTTFFRDYGDCLSAATERMADNAFAAIVTGPVRDKRGYINDLPADTTRIMERAGWRLYQDGVLITPTATAGLRASGQFAVNRKLVRTHQNIGIYHRGDLSTLRSWPPCYVPDES